MQRCANARESQPGERKEVLRDRRVPSKGYLKGLPVDFFELSFVFEEPILPFPEHTHEGRVDLRESVDDDDEILQPLGGVRAGQGFERQLDLIHDMVQNRTEYFLFALEMPIECSIGEAGVPADFRYRYRTIPLCGEKSYRAVYERLPRI